MPKTISGPILLTGVIKEIELTTKKWLAEKASEFNIYPQHGVPLQADTRVAPWSAEDFRKYRERHCDMQERDIGSLLTGVYNRGLFDEFLGRQDASATIRGYLPTGEKDPKPLLITNVLNVAVLRDTLGGSSEPDLSEQAYLIWSDDEDRYTFISWVQLRDSVLEKFEDRCKKNYNLRRQ